MSERGKGLFEWHLLEEDEVAFDDVRWETSGSVPARPRLALAPRTRRRLWRWLSSLSLVMLLVGGGWFWWRLRQIRLLVQRDVQEVVAQEALAWQAKDIDAFTALLDPDARSSWRSRELRRFNWYSHWLPAAAQDVAPEVAAVTLLGTHVEARVRYQQGAGGPAYEETLFFSQGATGSAWRRTAPDMARWGEPREAATFHFRLHYYARDAATVEALLPELERFYVQVRRDVGLEQTFGMAQVMAEMRGVTPLVIAVEPRTDLTSWRFVDDRLEIPSPELVRARADEPLSVELKRLIARPLADRVLAEAEVGRGFGNGPDALLHAFSHWAAEQWSGPGSWWWQVEANMLREAAAAGIDLTPTAQLYDGREGERVAHARDFFLVDYIATRYGRERVIPLILELRATPWPLAWPHSVPRILGVSYDDFLAGWEAYRDALATPP